ncbi:methyltransferase [Pyrolobus fumarii 1A]|uniref:Methyltransferase-like protein 5 n=1 Tax=Pyrolobus fumarii (strain DSM 11204 / 1A) TaxID=694429 RepID=G0EET3_PYRF1|nr:methyltransferase [Pyrolobus fumarii]AEM38047.1 methyltransferase [Pyrolobus fumarii 1A]
MVNSVERVSRKHLAIILSRVPSFERAKVELEQYRTDPEVAATLVYSVLAREGSVDSIADFGCGTGMLTYGMLISGAAAYAVCIDIDYDAIRVAHEFVRNEMFGHAVDLVVADARCPPLREKSIEVVVMNPPFGIRSRRGIDLEFLRAAIAVSNKVYSIHAWSDGLLRAIRAKLGCKAGVIDVLNHAIPAFLLEHRRRVHRVKVALVVVRGEDCETRSADTCS